MFSILACRDSKAGFELSYKTEALQELNSLSLFSEEQAVIQNLSCIEITWGVVKISYSWASSARDSGAVWSKAKSHGRVWCSKPTLHLDKYNRE